MSDQPCVNSVELTVGAAIEVGEGVRVGPEGVLDGVGVLVFRACGLLALAEPPRMLNINASTSTAVRIINRLFCLFTRIFLSVTFPFVTSYTNNSSTIYVILLA